MTTIEKKIKEIQNDIDNAKSIDEGLQSLLELASFNLGVSLASQQKDKEFLDFLIRLDNIWALNLRDTPDKMHSVICEKFEELKKAVESEEAKS